MKPLIHSLWAIGILMFIGGILYHSPLTMSLAAIVACIGDGIWRSEND